MLLLQTNLFDLESCQVRQSFCTSRRFSCPGAVTRGLGKACRAYSGLWQGNRISVFVQLLALFSAAMDEDDPRVLVRLLWMS